MTIAIEIHPANPMTDYERLGEILTHYENDPILASTLNDWDSRVTDGLIRQRFTTTLTDGTIVGYSIGVHNAWHKDGDFFCNVTVDPAYTGQGIGAQILAHVEAWIIAQGAQRLLTEVRDNNPRSLAFAEKHGYSISHHIFESVLPLANFDETPFVSALEETRASGIRFMSLAEAGNTPENQRKLYEVNRQGVLDLPNATGHVISFEDFSEMVFEASWFDPNGQILAFDGDEVIGLAAIMVKPENNSVYNNMTITMPSHRGRKIAQALKLLTIRRAIELKADFIRTNNHSLNAPMLAINRKFGYQPQAGFYNLRKAVEQ